MYARIIIFRGLFVYEYCKYAWAYMYVYMHTFIMNAHIFACCIAWVYSRPIYTHAKNIYMQIYIIHTYIYIGLYVHT